MYKPILAVEEDDSALVFGSGSRCYWAAAASTAPHCAGLLVSSPGRRRGISLAATPSSVSAHLRVLHNVNLLDFETRGRDRGRPTHLYRLREDARILLSALDELAQSVVPVPLARPPRRYAVVALIDEDALSPSCSKAAAISRYTPRFATA